jgi:hypothetical protein
MNDKRPPVLDKEFQIVIPTHNRPQKQITFQRLPPSLQAVALIVTSLESEAKAIRKNYSTKNVISLESFGALESHGQRIHTKRQWILENIRSKYILQLDDDLYYFRRCSTKYREYNQEAGRWKLNKAGVKAGAKLLYTATHLDIERMFAYFRKEVVGQYVHACFGSRMGNDLEEFEMDRVGGRSMHAICHHRATLLQEGIRFDEIDYREDFNVTLHLLKAGYPGFRLFCYTVSPNSYQAPGGCSSYRTHKASNRAAVRLATLHPGFVRLAHKDYKDHSRVEVMVAWRQAALKGQELGEILYVEPKDREYDEGMYLTKVYADVPPMFTHYDGKFWTVPSFNKPNLKTSLGWIRRLPFRVKPLPTKKP